MKISKANLKKAKGKKRGAEKGVAPLVRIAIMKRAWVALTSPSASAKVPTA